MPSKRSKNKASSQAMANLTPWPVKWVPPKDIPTTQRNPKRRVCIDLLPSAEAPTVIAVTAGSIRNRLVTDTSVDTSNIYYVLEKSAYWALPGPGQITIQDAVSGITVTDEGDYTNRAKVGIVYPKNIQQVVSPTTTGVFQSGNCDITAGVSGTQVWTSRHWVTYWSRSPNTA
jgi:hypothetical protein